MCGIIGVYNNPEAATLAYMGLYAQQHRGQEGAGVISSDGNKLHSHMGQGLVSDVFSDSSIFESLSITNSHQSGVSAHDYQRKTLDYFWDYLHRCLPKQRQDYFAG